MQMSSFKNLSPGVGVPVLCPMLWFLFREALFFSVVFLVALFSVSCPQELRMAPGLHSPVAVDQPESAAN